MAHTARRRDLSLHFRVRQKKRYLQAMRIVTVMSDRGAAESVDRDRHPVREGCVLLRLLIFPEEAIFNPPFLEGTRREGGGGRGGENGGGTRRSLWVD